jgi:dihydrofolate reductase
MEGFWPTIDTILMGRKTWEVAAASGGGGGGELSGIRTYLFSRTLTAAPPGPELVSRDAGAFVLDLKRRPGKGICVMGGGELACALLAAGAIDEVGLNIHPILLGAGVPLFRDAGRRIPLQLIASRVLDGGCVYATYLARTTA